MMHVCAGIEVGVHCANPASRILHCVRRSSAGFNILVRAAFYFPENVWLGLVEFSTCRRKTGLDINFYGAIAGLYQ